MSRLVYFAYYIYKLNWNIFIRFLEHTKKKYKKNNIYLLCDIVYCSMRYNISILEYFQFDFTNKSHDLRKTWAGTGFMYEFQKTMNPKKYRDLLEDKTIFLKNYKSLMKHLVIDIDELDKSKLEKIHSIRKLVFKTKQGGCGKGILVKNNNFTNPKDILLFMIQNKYDIVEEFIYQHEVIAGLSAGGLNTIRVITQLTSGDDIEIVAARIRMNVVGNVDNLAAGNIAAPIDVKTGVIFGDGVYSDITKPNTHIHPKTGNEIIGRQIPYWDEIITLVKAAAIVKPINRSIGWDIAILKDGPTLIEGNREWCKLLYQLPVKQGLKKDLEKYLK